MTDVGWPLRQTGWEAAPPTWTSLLLRGLEAKAASSLWLMATADVVQLPGAPGPGSNQAGSKREVEGAGEVEPGRLAGQEKAQSHNCLGGKGVGMMSFGIRMA